MQHHIGLRVFSNGASVLEDRRQQVLLYRRGRESLTFVLPFEFTATEYVLHHDVCSMDTPGADRQRLSDEQAEAVLVDVIKRLRAEGVEVKAKP